MSERDDLVFIDHIIESIKAIEEFSIDLSKSDLKTNRLKRSAIVREIEIIGEASKNLSEKFKLNFNKIPWKEISGTRDKMIHQYFGVDLDIIWKIIKDNLPELKKEMFKIKEKSKVTT